MSETTRWRITVEGMVQGVGFRPFVHRLASRYELGGFVLNDGRGVVVEAEGDARTLRSFYDALDAEAPPLARVGSLRSTRIRPRGERDFRIEVSERGPREALIPADLATCELCLRELWDPGDRRHRYPFINCTQCGPRFTIVERPPYDRANTTMAGFELCESCRSEYEDPADRRFHAEPIACRDCGPRLSHDGAEGEEALATAVGLLRKGAIVALKGVGGYHLACDAADEQAVARLRRRKRREQKPLALMTADPGALVEAGPADRELLHSPAHPIVLLPRRAGSVGLAPSVAPSSPWLGVMLPYSPLHHLLCADFGGPLVMTSGNRSDEPIATDDGEARDRLDGVADGFLTHDRPIRRRCEDSVVRPAFAIRRSRGLAPAPIRVRRRGAAPIVATGAELKSTFCVLRGERAFLSPHLGDLDNPLAYEAFRADMELYLEMLGVEPEVVAHDLHPDYLSTRWALEQEVEAVGVQHHHAHAAACLAENGESEALSLVFDGTGYGPDGTLWGGELLRASLGEYERLAHLEPVPLPGGEAAIREPWRMAAAYLERAERPVPFERWPGVRQSLAVNAPLSSGMGRLFDAAAALLGLGERVSYEGQAAIELEILAGETEARPYECRLVDESIIGADLVAAVHDDLEAGRPRAQIAAAFHEGVAAVAARACAETPEPRGTVALTGGSFQNLRLLRSLADRLDSLGFGVCTHRLVPPNDGGISFGQAAVAARRVG